MTDRELLEAAAKVVGLEHVTPMMIEWGQWDPLTDDGDALRLAMRLLFTVSAGHVTTPDNRSFDEGLLRTRQDINAATRRAIVRAAVALGEKME